MLPFKSKFLLLIFACMQIYFAGQSTGLEAAASENHDHNSANVELKTKQVPIENGENHQNYNDGEQDNIWNMVATMRQGGASGRGRVAADSSTFSKSLKLEWAIDLDAEGNYRLNWCANSTRNEIVFALNIKSSSKTTAYDESFRIGRDVFAIGFSERGQFESSDFCLIWYDLSHKLHLQDARTNANNELELIASSRSVCKLLNHHRSLNQFGGDQETRDSPMLKTEIDYEDDDAKLDAERDEMVGLEDDKLLSHLGRRHNHKPEVLHSDGGGGGGGENLEIIFTRPLEVCENEMEEEEEEQEEGPTYYAIDNGTTHLIWFALRGPLLALDGLNLTETLNQQQQQQKPVLSFKSEQKSKPNESFFGMRRVQMIATASAPGTSAATSLRRFTEFRMDKYKIPARETTYLCKLFKLPTKFETRRYHITSYEAAIESGKEHVVHHMELFNCANLNPNELDELNNLVANNWAGECGSPTRPPVTEKCKRVILAWAMGARPLVYPTQVGQSIGGRGYSPYVMLEVHYNNVKLESDLADSSGLRFHYSSKLRPYDAGVLEVGLEYTDKNSIPPGMVAPLAGYCVSECTRVAMSTASGGGSSLVAESSEQQNHYNEEDGEEHHHQHHHHNQKRPRARSATKSLNTMTAGREASKAGRLELNESGGIYIFAAQMHTHLTGVASWTEHVRGNRLLGELQRDNHYSPHFQEIRLLPKPIYLEPGDALIHYCLYDTRQRSNITLGGFATQDEMCVTYLHYYPRIDLEVCKSSVDSSALSDYFERLARDESQPTTSLNIGDETMTKTETEIESIKEAKAAPIGEHKSISENYRSIEWSKRRSRELIEFYNLAPLSVQCNRSDGSRWPGQWNGMPATHFDQVDHEFGAQIGALPLNSNGEQVESGNGLVRQLQRQRPFASGGGGGEPLLRQKSALELAEYRGFGAWRKEAQCLARRRRRGRGRGSRRGRSVSSAS